MHTGRPLAFDPEQDAALLARYVVMSVTGLEILAKADWSAADIEAVAETAIGTLR